jgi:hypothetical protein
LTTAIASRDYLNRTAGWREKDVALLTAARVSGLNNPSPFERIAEKEASHERPESCGSFSIGAQSAQP